MALLVGVVLALAVGLFARAVELDRDRAFYPTVTIVVASYYTLFAIMGGTRLTVVAESLVGAVFAVVAVVGFRSSLWLVVGALCAHGVFDLVHGKLISNPGVPSFWPAWCLAYDVMAGGFLAWLLRSRRIRAST